MWDKLKKSLFGGKKDPKATPSSTAQMPVENKAEQVAEEQVVAADLNIAQPLTAAPDTAVVEVTPASPQLAAEETADAAVELNAPLDISLDVPPVLDESETHLHAVTLEAERDDGTVEVIAEPVAEEISVAAEPAADAVPVVENVVEAVVEAEVEAAAPAPVLPVSEPEEEEAPVAAIAEQEKPKRRGFFERIKSGLSRTKANLTEGLASLFLGAKHIDDDLLEELETQLLLADVGMEATQSIVKSLTERVSRKELKDPQALYAALKDELRTLLAAVEQPLVLDASKRPMVILMVGVNGVGKTTTIGKLAKKYQSEGKKVMLAAGDTFRAAAVEQLQVWGERNKVPVIAQHSGADSAAVIYDALQAAKARGVDVLIADTAGRLQNKQHLMVELEKVVRVMRKLDPEAPHEVMLVLDAGTGQNAISQAKTFLEAVGVTGISLTKLDGTAKGGIIFAIAKQFSLPIRFIGVGEGIEDLRPFHATEFVDALFERNDA